MPALLLATEASGAPLQALTAAPGGAPVDFVWLVPLIPAVTAGLLLLVGDRLGRFAAHVAITSIGASATIATAIFVYLQSQPAGARTFSRELGTWIQAGSLDVSWSFLVDPLSSIMLLLVTWVGLLIHVYSVGYMHGDERYPRYFAYLNLFAASMLVLVLGESLLTVFLGWELVGLCSYLLVGFWFERPAYAGAAKKAFIVNRIGDVGFMLAMFVVFREFGSLSFGEILPEAGTVLGAGAAAAIALLLLVAATGKSAQIPLYVWLPDAMAGPTPVSALIHAATMVTAGVFLIARASPIFTLVPDVGLLVAWVGIATAFVAAAVACAQVDLKRILAYSTVSQLGYMFVGVGIGDYTAGIFHLLTHGFFKALLFLAAGSVMHALADETDVRRMGGLAKVMPVTFATSAVGVLAISGFPLTSGYYSKEEILASTAYREGGELIWVLGIVVAAMTAFYMTRWLVLIFLGPARWKVTAHPTASKRGKRAVAGEPARPALRPHESPLSMTLPLVVLAVLAAVGGVLNLNPETGFLHGWLTGDSVVAYERIESFVPTAVYTGAAIAAGVGGILLGYLMYRRVDIATVGVGGGPRAAAREAFRVDRLYELIVLAPGRALADAATWFDRNVIDGAVNGSAAGTRGLATAGRKLQTGFVRSYALAVLGGAVLLTVVLWSTSAGLLGS